MTPFERAVDVMGLVAMSCPYRHELPGDRIVCPRCGHAAMLRAALPHLLAAVVGEMRDGQGPDVVELPTMYLDGHTTGQVYRAALLAALTDAATRLRARAEATPPDWGRDG